MDQRQFVDALKAQTAEAAAEDTLRQWELPSGRLRSQGQVEQANWVAGLSELDRRMVKALVAETAQAALFGVLCVLDGARRIDASDDAHFELTRVEAGKPTLLARSDFGAPVLLHELLQCPQWVESRH
jgi:hypothetical protein